MFPLIKFFLLFLDLTFIVCTQDDEADYRQMAFEKKVGHLLVLPADAKDVNQMTAKVMSEMHCAFACVRETWCYSANFKTIPDGNGRHICELLSTDEATHGKHLKKDQDFILLKIKNVEFPCDKNPCTEKEECIPTKNRKGYRCRCKKGHKGKNCEKVPVVGLDNSTILLDYGNVNYVQTLSSYLDPVLQDPSKSRWVRCWHAASDGWDVTTTFHPQCDNKGPTVTIVRVGNYVFGGYSDVSWVGIKYGYYCSWSNRSFLYSLYNINGYQPVKLTLTGRQNYCAIYRNSRYGPVFGCGRDLLISNLASSNQKSHTMPDAYNPPPGCSLSSRCTFFAGSYEFTPNDVEVFYETTS